MPRKFTPKANKIPGQTLLHPLPLAAALLIVFNDFYLKIYHPGWISGKLSDFGLCIFLPVWLYALAQWATFARDRLLRRPWRPLPSGHLATASCFIAGAYFTALQLSQLWADLHVTMLGHLVPSRSFVVTPDISDLIALTMLPLAWYYLRSDEDL